MLRLKRPLEASYAIAQDARELRATMGDHLARQGLAYCGRKWRRPRRTQVLRGHSADYTRAVSGESDA